MEQESATSMGGLWFFSAITLVALFISAAAQGELTGPHVALAFGILTLACIGSVYFIRTSTTTQTKAKRSGLSDLLDNLSEDELIELKRRLSAENESNNGIVDHIGDDGELKWER